MSKALCSQDETERNSLLLKDDDLGVFCRENPLLRFKVGFLLGTEWKIGRGRFFFFLTLVRMFRKFLNVNSKEMAGP